MDLSIVIVNWNTCDLVRDCLASLPLACESLTWEVFVVDNDSQDDSLAMITKEFPAVNLISAGSNCGFSRGNNLALPATKGDYVLLLNPDTVCPHLSLARLVAFAATKQALGAVGPLLTTAEGTPTITYGYFPRPSFHWLGFIDPARKAPFASWQKRVIEIPKREDTSHQVEYVMGACFLMPRAALENVGNLDETFFMYFEETDWCRRAHDLGLENWYYADSEVVHLEGQASGTVSQFSLLQFQKSYRIYVAKHGSNAQMHAFRWAQFAEYGLKAFLRRLAPGDRQKNKALAQTYWTRAKLQCRSQIDVTPPGSKS
ncbi:MAG: N-acetylglucosaminyl-diphospho-decaprenol L-rhamnosyltransferase [Candidatus Krumholzibacteriia bacterium]|jgi:N-acetylglucosaminyl-diphospho-decaprenol L-rhamnosyltransferase